MPSIRDGDFRSEAKDRRRVKNHNIKWSRGAQPAPGKACTHNPNWYFIATDTCGDCAKRPWPYQRPTITASHWDNHFRERAHHRARKGVLRDANADLEEYPGTSAEEDAYDEAQADSFYYSFDAPTGPIAGQCVLGNAVVQAVARFENKETEKIVREYDLVADGKDELDFASADDDFELVDSAQL